MTDTADTPHCSHPNCPREADYRVELPGRPPVDRCRWHTDELWRPHGAQARVVALHGEVPSIDTSRADRRTVVPALLIAACVVIVALGFAALAPVMF